MVVDQRDATVDFIRLRGPSLPAQLAKHLGSNTLLASAVLSELAGKGKVKISKMKVGGSPLCFTPGQEEQLLKFLESLDEKDRRTVWLLQERKVLRDTDMDPLVRVSLRQIKDFAVQLHVTIGNQTEIFWKYFAVPEADVHGLIERCLAPKTMRQELVFPAEDAQVVKKPAVKQRAPRKRKVVESPLTVAEIKDDAAIAVAAPVVRVDQEVRKITSPVTPIVMSVPVVEVAVPREKPSSPNESSSSLGRAPSSDGFFNEIASYFSKHKIELVEHEIVKRNVEHDCVVRVPSPVGALTYYCKAKQKQKLGELDVSAAFAQGQLRKLPVLLLGSEITPKAAELAQRLKCVTFSRLE